MPWPLQHPIEYTLIWIVLIIVVCAPLAVIVYNRKRRRSSMAGAPLSVCISGALGNVGRRLVEGVRDDPGFTLHSAVARREVGRDVGEALGGAPLGVTITDDIEVALAPGPTC